MSYTGAETTPPIPEGRGVMRLCSVALVAGDDLQGFVVDGVIRLPDPD